MLCKHQFFKTGEVSRQQDADAPRPKFVVGVEVVCVDCGEVRHAFADGKVVIKVQGGKPIDEDIPECGHEWVDATNTHIGGSVASGHYCRKCGKVRHEHSS